MESILQNSRLCHLFYYSIKMIVEGRESGRTVIINALTMPITVFYALRAALVMWTMLTDYRNSYWHYDYLLCFARTNTHLYDSLLATAVIFVGIFVHKAKMGFITSPLKIWKYFYKLVVANMDCYRTCGKSAEEVVLLRRRKQGLLAAKLLEYHWIMRFLPKRVLKLYCVLKARWSIWVAMDHINLNKFRKHKIEIYEQEAPLDLRIKLVLTVTIIDKVCFAIQVFIYCLCIVFATTYGPAFVAAAPAWYHIPMIVLDMAGLFYAFPLLLRCACIYSLCSFTGNLVYTYKLTKCEQLIQGTIRSFRYSSRRGRRSSMSVVNLHKNFEYFYSEHTRICAHVLYGNSKIWSAMMFSFLTTNVPANVYFITHLLFDDLPLFEMLFYSVIMAVQMTAAVFVLLRLAKNSKLIHSFARYIPAIQQLIPGQNLIHVKYKFDHLLHRLTSTKYGMTVGPVFLITYESVFKILLIYIYYLMFAFIFRRQRLIL